MDQGKAGGPKWWSRPEPVSPAPPEAQAPPRSGPSAAQPSEPAQDAVPRHGSDPYDTPPYGEPGPWAPAPPVTRPADTAPPSRPPLPPAPPYTANPAPPPLPVGQWHRYDPWAAPGPLPAAPRTSRRRGPLAAGLVALTLVAGGIGGALGAYVAQNDGSEQVTLPQVTRDAGKRAPDSVAGIAAKVLPGVVYIHVKSDSGEGTGTGFVLDDEGHILTNNHVVETVAKSGTISVTFNGGQIRSAKIVGRDTGYDLAVIKVSGVKGLRPVALGNSDAAQVGDPVVAIGAPYGLEGTVTSGIISATQRPITAGGETEGSDVSYVDAIQTDAPINPGNSGGPLVDSRGLVIGINSAIRSADTGSDPFGNGGQGGSIGLGFAIPVNQAKRVAEQLINNGKATHPVIGVSINLQYEGDGAQVSPEGEGDGESITPNGPGAKAGIEPGDVITAIDGKRVHSGEELIVRIRSHRPGDKLALTLKRGGKQRSVQLVLGSATG
ncbi:trypsin-like peptidase domain-containing protein [Streptomyces sp. NPDC088354]|uniref:S1C family serine protease n=1 Tax=unclassified Streptomyces TaxID=2593676 RepID=UPI0029BC9E45|nr:trypsin-like peptidase domain-containing protein [Streptomyces sp. MI02-7b]MDX3078144.1 trypsin-like peptidase domain-containing protein [Streptomyces sp. MI02-7b]